MGLDLSLEGWVSALQDQSKQIFEEREFLPLQFGSTFCAFPLSCMLGGQRLEGCCAAAFVAGHQKAISATSETSSLAGDEKLGGEGFASPGEVVRGSAHSLRGLGPAGNALAILYNHRIVLYCMMLYYIEIQLICKDLFD